MRSTDKRKNILVVLLASAALTALTLVALMSESAPVGASQAVFLQGAADNVSIAKSAATGSGNNSVVYNGETITYTITITNNSASSSATNVSIQDTLPKDALDNIQCLGGCGRVVDTSLIPEPTGGTVVVTMTRQLTWTVDALVPRESRQVVFWGRVKGQADGTLLTNRAFVRYDLGGSTQSADSNDVQTTVRVQMY